MSFVDYYDTTVLQLMEGFGDLTNDVLWQRSLNVWPSLSLEAPYTSLGDTGVGYRKLSVSLSSWVENSSS